MRNTSNASWEMQVQVSINGEKAWVSIQASDATEPYRYPSQREAQQMLEGCYPDIMSDLLRVVQVNFPPNIGKGVQR